MVISKGTGDKEHRSTEWNNQKAMHVIRRLLDVTMHLKYLLDVTMGSLSPGHWPVTLTPPRTDLGCEEHSG